MIIKSYDEVPYITCTAADIRPERKGEFSGTLETSDGFYDVSITRDEHRGETDRVWARVRLMTEVEKSEVDHYATGIAEKAFADPAWDRVKVDLRDGETAYMRTWTHDFPDGAGMDEFLLQAAAFIEKNMDELRTMANVASDGGFDFSSLF